MSKFYVTQVPSADANPVGFVTTAFYEDRDQTPPPVSALREMFVSLWTHLDEVSWRANALSKSRDELSDSMRSGLAGIAKIADVGAVYGSMQRILAEETSKQAERLDHSRARMADLIAENAKLRMELAEARGGKGVH